MRLKNYNEELVLETVKVVLKDRKDVKATRPFILDVAAYTLNRIPPKYITSERGITHELISSAGPENGERLIDVIELITLVHRAIDVVAGRRKAGDPAAKKTSAGAGGDADGGGYFYNLPPIFGRVIDSQSGKPVISADATLYVNGKIAKPAEPGWQNPYRTNEHTKGYFSFWPKAHSGGTESLRVEISIGLRHSRYKPCTFRKTLKVPGEIFVHDYVRGDRLLDLGSLELEPAEK
jgi:competence protein ComFB